MSEINRSPAFWRSFSIFEEFDTETITLLSGIATHRKWQQGAMIFQRGDAGHEMIAVTSGRIKISLLTPQGRELLLRHIEAGSLFGEVALLDGKHRSADATALVATEGYVIARKPFLDLVTHRPQAGEAILRYLCSMLRDTTERLETIALYDLNSRVARFFLATLKQIHGTELPESANLRLTLSQADIAAILGASRPKVNRAILTLEENGAIHRHDGVITCHIGLLQAFAEPEEA